MDQEKRVLIAFALSFGVLLLWRALLVKVQPPPPRPTTPATTSPRIAPGQQSAVPSPAATLPSEHAVPHLAVTQGNKPQEIDIDGRDLYRVTFSTEGAVVKSWVLKKYRDAKENPLDVVNRAACEKLGFPMSLNVSDPEISAKLNSAIYVASPANASLPAPARVDFLYSDGKIQARKQFTFGPGYEAHAEVSVFDGERYLPLEVTWPGGFGDHSLSYATQEALTRAVYGAPDHLTAVAQGKVKEGEDRRVPGPLLLAGLEDRFFVDIFLPDSSDDSFRFARQVWTPPDWTGEEKNKPKPLTAALGTPLARPLSFRLFVAPKDLDVLRAARPPLDGLVDFGWFSIVARPLFVAMRYIYDHWIHNYGWAIVILTVLINLAMFPLKLKSIRSAQEMQRIAPIVKGIQDKYKQYKLNDPRKQRMNQEVMKVYQEHNINPLGGCLPMVVQLPFLYGFYRVLDLSIELRHAPWILWVRDLSSPDSYHLFGFPLSILPTVMIITMFILQKMTPVATVDPAQQRMMMVMPLIFGIMFYNFASGLVLYWLTGNIVGIAQQAFINRMIPPAQPGRPVRRPPEAEVEK